MGGEMGCTNNMHLLLLPFLLGAITKKISHLRFCSERVPFPRVLFTRR